MKQTSIAASLLLLAGFILLTYQGVVHLTREKAVDSGAFRINEASSRTLPLSPIAGIAMVGAGVFLLVQGRRVI